MLARDWIMLAVIDPNRPLIKAWELSAAILDGSYAHNQRWGRRILHRHE